MKIKLIFVCLYFLKKIWFYYKKKKKYQSNRNEICTTYIEIKLSHFLSTRDKVVYLYKFYFIPYFTFL